MSDRFRVGILATHPVQYYAPWYRALARRVDLDVYFSHRQTPADQARAGFGVEFAWDVPLLDGYHATFLNNVASRPSVNRFWGCITPDIARAIQRRAYDAFVVQGWMTASYWQAIVACWRSGTPVMVRGDSHLVTERAAWRRMLKWPIYRWFIPRFDAYLVVGEQAREYLMHYGAPADRCFDAPHSVDNEFFSENAKRLRANRGSVRSEMGVPQQGTTFLFAGKFVDGKEADVFVQAVASAAQEVPGVNGLMAGDGPLRGAVEALARELRAPIRFAGFLNQQSMVKAYAASDVLVVPSRSETWGLVVNEAMASGLPAVVSEGVGCAKDLIVAGQTGYTFPVGDSENLAGRLATIARDPAHLDVLARNARTRVGAVGIGATVEGTVRAVESIAARRGRRDLSARVETQPMPIGNSHD